MKTIVHRYSDWLGEENARAGIPNWMAQATMGVLAMLVGLLSMPALLAWLHGADWNSTIQTATRHGNPVMRPLGTLILIGVTFFGCGFTLLLTAILCRPTVDE